MTAKRQNGRIGVSTPFHQAPKGKKYSWSSMIVFFVCFLSSILSFYIGIGIGLRLERSDSARRFGSTDGCNCGAAGSDNSSIDNAHKKIDWVPKNQNHGRLRDSSQQVTLSEASRRKAQEEAKIKKNNREGDAVEKRINVEKEKIHYIKKFEGVKGSLFAPMTEFVDRDEFIDKFEELGVPFDKSEPAGNDRVMIVYGDKAAFPNVDSIFRSDKFGKDNSANPNRKKDVFLSVDAATENCNNLHVVLTNPDRPNQCVALVGQYESFHVQKFMRASPKPDPSARSGEKFIIDRSYPLRMVNRGMKTDGGRSVQLPTHKDLKANWKSLAAYLLTLEDNLEAVKPLAESVAKHNKHSTVIIMVCNFGQSELLMNCKLSCFLLERHFSCSDS